MNDEKNENLAKTVNTNIDKIIPDKPDKPDKPDDKLIKKDEIKIKWSIDNEQILVEWCDVAQCYKWLNLRSHGKYSTWHAWFTIPAIILSTISGTASFAQATLPDTVKPLAPAVIGSINLVVGILGTVQQYLKISELNEAHRVSAISWDKFARNIKIELTKKPLEREDAGNFIKICRQEYDRLMETSPPISDKVISEFNGKFSGKPGTDKRSRFDKLRKPDICDTIVSLDESRNKWYDEILDVVDSAQDAAMREKDNFILQQQMELTEKREEIVRQTSARKIIIDAKNSEVERQIRINKENEIKYTKSVEEITIYIDRYIDTYNRKPTHDELFDNLDDQIDNVHLMRFIAEYTAIEEV
tara:strand:- start:610 stop:1683 length:1074 start_codon:yes stop_codon:yes gene_type:complete